MQIIDFWVQEPYKTYILDWVKTIEWRLNKWKFNKLSLGDILEFDTWEKFKVVWKFLYNSFKDMLINEWIKNVIPDKKTIEEAVNVYYKFYTKEQEKEFWVIAIQISKI